MPRKKNITIKPKHKDKSGEVREYEYKYFKSQATIGRDPEGKPIRKTFYGASKKEAENKRDEFLAGLKQGLAVDYQKTTFGNAFRNWLEHVHRGSIGHSTYVKYECFHRLYIAGCELSGMKLADIRAANIQGYYNALKNRTTLKNIHQVHKLLTVFFNYCVNSDILIKSPLLAVELPKLPMKDGNANTALSERDLGKLIKACREDLKYFPFLFAAFTGLRSGELRALNYSDIDLRKWKINVDKSVKYSTVDGVYKPILSETKTAASIRKIPILEPVQGLLIEHIKSVKEAMPTIPFSGDFLLFPSYAGTYIEQNNFLDSYQRLCDRLGIRQGRTVHSLRHTFCTILARQGVSLLDASRLMGHSNTNVTAKIYSHVTDDDKKAAVDKLRIYFA